MQLVSMAIRFRGPLSARRTEMMDVLSLDGSHGEGGGQILRTALSLSAVTARPLHITNIRASRRPPGLLPQHLSAVRAAAAITKAVVSGDRLGSTELSFTPSQSPKSGAYVFDVAETAGRGSAGSVTPLRRGTQPEPPRPSPPAES